MGGVWMGMLRPQPPSTHGHTHCLGHTCPGPILSPWWPSACTGSSNTLWHTFVCPFHPTGGSEWKGRPCLCSIPPPSQAGTASAYGNEDWVAWIPVLAPPGNGHVGATRWQVVLGCVEEGHRPTLGMRKPCTSMSRDVMWGKPSGMMSPKRCTSWTTAMVKGMWAWSAISGRRTCPMTSSISCWTRPGQTSIPGVVRPKGWAPTSSGLQFWAVSHGGGGR